MTTASFVTADDLARDLRAFGVPRGGVLMVHSSLSSLGRVLGGAPAVVRAFLAALGPDGTLVMPAFSPEVSDPARWPDWSLSGEIPCCRSSDERAFRRWDLTFPGLAWFETHQRPQLVEERTRSAGGAWWRRLDERIDIAAVIKDGV